MILDILKIKYHIDKKDNDVVIIVENDTKEYLMNLVEKLLNEVNHHVVYWRYRS